MKFLALAGLLFVAGCGGGLHVVTGQVHPPTNPADVKIYNELPEKFEVIGIVKGIGGAGNQRGVERALAEAKKQAAQIGATGLLISPVASKSKPQYIATQYGGFEVDANGAVINATAIFVP
jgi:hypothetical protein